MSKGLRKIRWRRVLLFVVLPSTLVCAALAVPNLIEAHKHGNEASAVGALATIGAAQALFREADKEKDGTLDYGTLKELGEAGLIDELLASGTRKGYIFEATYSPTTSEFLWCATARPITPGRTGDRHFGTTQQGVAFYSTTRFVIDPITCDQPPNVGVT